MTLITRRSLLVTGTLGVAALAIPGFAQAPGLLTATGFTHSVASGEPGPDTMLCWTRYVAAAGDSATLRLELSETDDFARIAAGGQQTTGAWRDWTVKITATGLRPCTRYFYRFVAPDGTMSPVGRTRTLPVGDTRRFRAAIFSCSNMPYGWFNAYGHAAARGDLDCAIHLGDYFYEYAPDHYASKDPALAGRIAATLPAEEIVHLADYRLRYASYRADPDLMALHAAMPMIAQWDDHESANDSWEGGAQNHDPATEGDWNARRAAAVQAYREWMPVSDEPYKTYEIGRLATLFSTETRLFSRSRQRNFATLVAGATDRLAALRAFRDDAWHDPAATMMGSTQEAWLAHGLARSVKDGVRWQVVGFGTIMGDTRMPADAARWVDPANAGALRYVGDGVLDAQAGLPFNFDNWGGYPAARARFLSSVRGSGAQAIVISGDSHNAWAYDLAQDGPVAVEFAGHSVSSPGFENSTRADPRIVARGLVAANYELKWCDTSRRGYMALTIEPDRVTNDWLFVDTIVRRSTAASIGHTATVRRGRRMMDA